MPRIAFVGTVHGENGLCNDEELFKILRTIEPEVIFEEIRPPDFDLFYAAKSTLECKAVVKYRQYRTPTQVPVDRYEIPRELVSDFKEQVGRIFDYVDDKTQECWLIMDELDRSSCRLGFKYLNSSDHARKWELICEFQDRIVFETGNQDWIRLLKKHRLQQNQRDIEMVRNIYEYCEKNSFATGVFLVGASHKTGVVKEIEKRSFTNSGLINWSFFDGDRL